MATEEAQNKGDEDCPPPPYPGPPGTYNYNTAVPGVHDYAAPPPGEQDYSGPPPAYPVNFATPGGNVYPPGGGLAFNPYSEGTHPFSPPAAGYKTTTATGYVAPGVVVTTQPMSNDGVFVTRGHQPSSYLALAIVTCLCFSPLCGVIAICFSVMSQNSYIAGDSDGAKRNGNMALVLSVAGIALSTIILGVLVVSGQAYVPST